MKKILLVGKLNRTVQEMYESLSRRFQVQVSAETREVVQGMMPIIKPDMVLVSVMELEDVENNVFDLLDEVYRDTPVLVVGTTEGCSKYQTYYERSQFAKLVRPISKEQLIQVCYQVLDSKGTILEGESIVLEEEEETKRILIVDDSPVTLRSIKAMLDKTYHVAVATSGEQALKSIGRERPDLILLDYDMPGWDGRETFEKIREDELVCDIPVIFLTGVADKDHIAAVLKLNPAGYFLKPPVREKLLAAIADVLKGKEVPEILDLEISL